MAIIVLTQETKNLLKELAEDASNWNGVPLLPELTQEQKGNLTDLKKKKLLSTDKDDGCDWVYFTKTGLGYILLEFGIDIELEA